MLWDDFSYKPLCLCTFESRKGSSPFGSELGTCAYEALYLHLLTVSLLE